MTTAVPSTPRSSGRGTLAAAGWAFALGVLLLAACDRGSAPKRALQTAEPASPASGLQAALPPVETTVDPPNGATDVDPLRTTLSATFDRPMDPEGWAWVIEHPTTAPELGEATWDAGQLTNTSKVRLEPGRSYVVWLNSPQYSYFRDRQGVAAKPFRWTFSTRPASPGAAAPVPLLSAHGAGATPPHVVRLDPPNGSVGVDPGQIALRATFDRPMQGSWSWVKEGESFPPTTGPPRFEADAQTAVLPVKLVPRTDLRGLAQQRGVPAVSRHQWRTRPAAALDVHHPEPALNGP